MSTGTRQPLSVRPGRMAVELERHSRRATAVPTGDVVLLDSGDPDFATPAHIREALFRAVREGHTHYSEPFGLPPLREALADEISRRAGRHVPADQVLITHGASAGLAAAVLACLDPGDKVVIPEPTYSLYVDHVRIAGAEPRMVPVRSDFHLDIDALARAAAGARMIILNHPCNPTGAVFTRDELTAVGRIAVEQDLLVLSDEAYDAIVFDDKRFVSALEIVELADRLIYCQTFSKKHAMTGWRIGYLALPAAVAAAAGRIHFSLHGPLNPAIQLAALAATTGPLDHTTRMLSTYTERRAALLERLGAVPGLAVRPPEGTFYCFLRYPRALPSMDLARLAVEHGVAVRAGSEFGDAGEGHLRLSFTSPPDVLAEGIERLVPLLCD